MNLYETIVDEMQTDDQSSERISQRLESKYKYLKTVQKYHVNDFFISLTGWSLKTLIDKSKKQ